MRRGRIVFLGLALFAAPLAACTSSDDPGSGEARLEVDGDVEVAAPGAAWREAREGLLRRGTRVRVRAGSAYLTFADDIEVELRDESVLQLTPRPRLLAGDALVVARETSFSLGARTAVVRVDDGAARVRRTLAVEAAVYLGRAEVSSAGRTLLVPALRQAVVAGAGLVPSRPSPLVYRGSHPWDRRFLGEWIALGDDLEGRSRGLTAQVDGRSRPASFFRGLLPGLARERAFTSALLVGAPPQPGETLVGAAIALSGTRGTFESRWAGLFAFRGEGAAWGLVALDQLDNGSRLPLLRSLEAALAAFSRSTTETLREVISAPIEANRPSTPSTPPTTAPPPGQPPPSQAPPPTTTPPRNQGPVPEPPTTNVPVVDTTTKAVVDVVNGLLQPPGG